MGFKRAKRAGGAWLEGKSFYPGEVRTVVAALKKPYSVSDIVMEAKTAQNFRILAADVDGRPWRTRTARGKTYAVAVECIAEHDADFVARLVMR